MFWRFGFSAASGIDALLDKDDVSLEAILDEDELLQECKAQNTRLIEYFQHPDVLKRLLGYITGDIESEGGRFKYPHVATEVLCSEIWSIVETCIDEQTQLLVPFWDSLLDRSSEEMRTQMVMAGHFARINAVFLGKKPAEMLAFIQSIPDVVPRILKHIENPSFVDLLVRIIQLDEYGVLEWLSAQTLMPQLIERLAPERTPELHVVIADLIKGIISLATPSPGDAAHNHNGTSSNLFARELARKGNVEQLVDYALRNFALGDDDEDRFEAASSSVIQSIGVVIELIRKNNSDYFEPYLFHTLRNRLMQVQPEDMERTMGEMVEQMGVVHLGPVLEVVNDNLHVLVRYLKAPRSSPGTQLTTVGPAVPLTFERFRICELVAELLHCSNMSLLNRPKEQNERIYDAEGRLTGGLAGLEELAKIVDLPNSESMDDIVDSMELPISESLIDSDEDMSDDEVEVAVSVPVPASPSYAGEKLKARLLELDVVGTLLDLFFEYPWNNFLHSTVYDVVHQVLTGNLESGCNGELAVGLFREGRLMERIVEGQRRNDEESARPKGVRLGFMGHLQMIAEDVLLALESFPPHVRLGIIGNTPEWDEYVTGRYLETKKRDSTLLGGGKPVVGVGVGVTRWKIDEEDDDDGGGQTVTLSGAFRRGSARREGSADFGPAPMQQDELSTESDDDDDDDAGGGWLSRASPFTLGAPPRERRPLSLNGFDDTFGDDDAFGPFSDSAAVSHDAFFTSLSDEMADSSFESFGDADFGEFQGADDDDDAPKDGELTPTAGSWTFASDSSDSGSSAQSPVGMADVELST